MGERSAFIRLATAATLLIAIALGTIGIGRASVAAPSASSVEASVLAKVDAGSPGSFELHVGLADVARDHSVRMASRKQLSHDGADDRPESADPVPHEANGAPDDGHAPPSVSCENVAYVFPADKDPATEIYRLWLESPPHKACMDRTDTNVAGVGVHFDGERWWATFIAMTDRTPPSSKGRSTKPDPAPKPEPKAKPSEPAAPDPQAETTSGAESGNADEPTFVAAPVATDPPSSKPPEPMPTSFAEATVDLPPVEAAAAQIAAPDLIATTKGRPPLPQSVFMLVIVLAVLGMLFVWRTTKPSVEQTDP